MRPLPPPELLEAVPPIFAPAPELEEWTRSKFINELSPVYNPEHVHLQMATIGMIWTNVENAKRGRSILGQAQLVTESGDKWSAGRSNHQLRQWFGELPDFTITLFAPYAHVEEFVGVVRRYGADAAGVREMVAAANKGPEIAEGLISRACGTCLRLVKG